MHKASLYYDSETVVGYHYEEKIQLSWGCVFYGNYYWDY